MMVMSGGSLPVNAAPDRPVPGFAPWARRQHVAVDLTADSAGTPVVVVLMGVSGTGKTAVGRAVTERIGWPFAEGDDFHSEANKAKMTAGRPLTDEDRWPWLRAIAEWIGRHPDGAVVSCSALRRPYRDLLRAGGPRVRFIHLVASTEELERRMRGRKHYMPVSLLQSQLDTLEQLEPDEPGVIFDDSSMGIEELADLAIVRIREWMRQ
jgi:gluconokinase